MEISDEKFENLKKDAESLYKSFGDILCPYLGEKLTFNAQGLEHVKFRGRNRARNRDDQYIRLRYLKLAPEVIKRSHTVQGVSAVNKMERLRTNSRWDFIMCRVRYHEFVAVIEEVRVRIIIKSINESPYYFWSIIPFWRMDKDVKKRLMHNGNPEED